MELKKCNMNLVKEVISLHKKKIKCNKEHCIVYYNKLICLTKYRIIGGFKI